MMDSYTFVRGQVWYWEDPIYGKKEYHEDVAPFDANIHFSRYVIVAQTTETVNNNSVLVIPCSSGTRTGFDVVVPLYHLNRNIETTPFARLSTIFPAHPRSLKRYVCTLSDSVMKKIDRAIMALLIPGSDITGMEKTEEPTIKEVRKIVQEDEPVKRRIGTKRWDEETIKSFIKVYNEEGALAAGEQFKLKPLSVKKYYAQWSKDSGMSKTARVKSIEVKAVIPDNASSIDPFDNIKITSTNDTPFVISKLANMMKESLYSMSLFNDVKAKLPNTDISPINEFYKDVNGCVYHSLLEFLGIKKEFGTFTIKKFDKHSKNIGTWYFIDRMYYDERIANIGNGITLMREFNKYHGSVQSGIDHEWLEVLKHKLIPRLKMGEEVIDMICEKIGKLYCDAEYETKAS